MLNDKHRKNKQATNSQDVGTCERRSKCPFTYEDVAGNVRPRNLNRQLAKNVLLKMQEVQNLRYRNGVSSSTIFQALASYPYRVRRAIKKISRQKNALVTRTVNSESPVKNPFLLTDRITNNEYRMADWLPNIIESLSQGQLITMSKRMFQGRINGASGFPK